MASVYALNSLSPEEIKLSSEIIKKNYPEKDFIFNSITLSEPDKSQLFPLLEKEWRRRGEEVEAEEDVNSLIERKSFIILIEKGSGRVFEALVNLKNKNVESFQDEVEGKQPTLTPEDCFNAEKIAINDEEVLNKFFKLGFSKSDIIVGDPWSVGYNCEPEFENKRLVQLFMYARNYEGDNHYAHPLDFVTVVDLNAEKVIKIEDLPIHAEFKVKRKDGEKVEVPKKEHNYENDILGKDFYRKDLKEMQIISPEGPSFLSNGNVVEWQKFKFQISFNYREGLVLHNITYKDGDKIRPLIYRASISEMAVPYGDPRPPFHRKCAFDVGDYGLGFCANSLELGCDCLGTIKYFDGVLNDHSGNPVVIKNAICMHEEDAGLLWKHTEYRTQKFSLARSRRLVLSFIVTVVNYEYAFYWAFYQDGTISLEIKATGELSTTLMAKGEKSFGHETIVGESILAQFHQHIFAARIDPMFDGQRNSVSAVDVVPLEGEFGSEENPYGQGFNIKETKFSTVEDAKSQISPFTSRAWKIKNANSIHPLTKEPVAWKLVPSNGQPLLAKDGGKIRERAVFSTNSVWVTPYKKDELYPAGFYVNQSKGGGGLPEWRQRDLKCSVDNEDIVLWHSFGVTHIPRVEDFPVMPVESTGFTLKPSNFFQCNPGLDVPPTEKIKNKSSLFNDEIKKCC